MAGNILLKGSGTIVEHIIQEPPVTVTASPGNFVTPIYFGRLVTQLFNGIGNLSNNHYGILQNDYFTTPNLKLKSLWAFYELPSKKLARMVDIDVDDSDAVKTDKLIKNYALYEKIGLKLWVFAKPSRDNQVNWNANDNMWFPCGETILQNKGLQMKINLLPYLGSEILEMWGAIGFQIIDKGNGKLGMGDYISIRGEWECEIYGVPKVIGAINLVPQNIS